MHLRKTKTANGRIYLAIVDSYYNKQRKMSRSKTIQSLGYLEELEKLYVDPIAHFQKLVDGLKAEKNALQAPINFTFYDSDHLRTFCRKYQRLPYLPAKLWSDQKRVWSWPCYFCRR